MGRHLTDISIEPWNCEQYEEGAKWFALTCELARSYYIVKEYYASLTNIEIHEAAAGKLIGKNTISHLKDQT
jgi:hypothetical protein